VPERAARGRTGTPLVLSEVEFDVVWRGLGLGAPPVVLHLASPGRTHTQRRHIEARVWAALRERGLTVTPSSALGQLVGPLAAPSPRLEVRAWGAAPCRAVVAGHSDGGVLARRVDGAVVLQPCRSVAAAATGLLAGGRAGPGRAAAVPDAALEGALRSPSRAGLRADLVARGADATEAGLVARMLQAVGGRAQIGVAVPDRWGVVRRSPGFLEVLDGRAGRYLLTRSLAGDGTCWATVAPLDDRRLHQRVAALLPEHSVQVAVPHQLPARFGDRARQ
jgi:hypothetical protein